MQPEEAQTEQEAEDALYNTTAFGAGEEVQGQAVPKHSGKGRIFQFA